MPFGTCEAEKQDKTIRISIRFIFLSFSTAKEEIDGVDNW